MYQKNSDDKTFSVYPEVIEIKPFYHTNFKESLGNVFLKDKPKKESSIVGRLFSNKTEVLKSTAKSLLEEIILRETLDSHILNNINEDISWQKTQLDHMNSLKVHYAIDWFKEISKIKMHMEDNILELEHIEVIRNVYEGCQKTEHI